LSSDCPGVSRRFNRSLTEVTEGLTEVELELVTLPLIPRELLVLVNKSFQPVLKLLILKKMFASITQTANFRPVLQASNITIGAKRGGTREQCSQKLFELAEIFRKIIQIIKNYKYIECIMKKGKISQISPYSKYFLLYLAFYLTVRPRKINFLQKFSESLTAFPESKKLSALALSFCESILTRLLSSDCPGVSRRFNRSSWDFKFTQGETEVETGKN
jgi:hypothetical protein